MKRSMAIKLTTLCMIRNEQGQILVQDRQKKDWPGLTFPGGHVEKDEDIQTAVIREVHEETGLLIEPELVGIAEWLNDKNGGRELAALFVAKTTQTLPEKTEQPLLWLTEEALLKGPLAGSLNQLLPIFFKEKQFFFKDHSSESPL